MGRGRKKRKAVALAERIGLHTFVSAHDLARLVEYIAGDEYQLVMQYILD